MNANVITARIDKSDGTIHWDRYTPDKFYPVICPKRGNRCSIFCPLVMLGADGEHILFLCGSQSVEYKIEPIAKPGGES